MSKRKKKGGSSSDDESSDEESNDNDKKESKEEESESEDSDESSEESEEKDKKKKAKKPPPKRAAKKQTKKPPKKKAKKDPHAPKKPTTAYVYYTKDKRAEFQAKHQGIKFGDLSKKISAAWKALTDEERKPFIKKHEEDKERYNKEMENYQKPDSDSSDSDSDDSSDDKKKKGKKRAPPKKKKVKDPLAPKPKTNAYMYFQKEKRESIKKQNPDLKGVPELAKKMGEIWRGMSESEKKPFTDLALKDKDRYDKEMEEYKKNKSKEN